VRKDQHAIHVSVDGVDFGIFDKKTGGEVDSSETTYQPGAMGQRISLGGVQEITALTVDRLFDLDRDGQQVHWLMSRVGKGDMVCSVQPLDVDGNVYGRPMTYKGKLKMVTPPEADSESSDAALISLEMTPAGSVV